MEETKVVKMEESGESPALEKTAEQNSKPNISSLKEKISEAKTLTKEKETQEKNNRAVMSNKKLILIVCSPILLPILMCGIIMFCMFIGCGWFFVALTFFGSAASAAVGVCGIIAAFLNAANGAGAILIALSCSFLGFSAIYPVFLLAKEFLKGFLVLSGDLIKKFQDLKNKGVKFFKEM